MNIHQIATIRLINRQMAGQIPKKHIKKYLRQDRNKNFFDA